MRTRSRMAKPSTEWTGKREILERELARVLAPDGDRAGILIEPEVETVDEVRAGADREMAGRQLDLHARLANEIRWAMKRIDTGEYGICANCGSGISEQRLEALPWARLCVSCQAREEWIEEHPELADAAA